jgi:CSLREA domain-containing protein
VGKRGDRGWIRLTPVFVVCAAVLCLALTAAAGAKTFAVTKTSDPTPGACQKRDCSLREAISAANQRPGTDTVVLKAGKTYRETQSTSGEDANASGDFDVTDSLKIRPSSKGKGKATVDALDNDRVMHVISTKLTINRLVLTNGLAQSPGGGLYASASAVSINSSRIEHNRVLQYNGGGIEASSTFGEDPSSLRISDSTITRNSGFGLGAGIDAQANLVMTDSTVSHNRPTLGGPYGGGLYVGGTTTLRHDRILQNRSGGPGGGIFANSNSALTIDRTIISGNEASGDGGGLSLISSFATPPYVGTTITNSTITGNRAEGHGGGIANGRLLKITKSTLADNETAIGGGAIANREVSAGGPVVLELTNDTLAGNRADGFGGGVDNFDGGDLLLKSVTVTGNMADADNAGGGAGGGLHNSIQQSNVPISNPRDSLVADNRVGSSGTDPDCYGNFISLGHNLISELGSCTGFNQPGDRVEPNPKLGSLGSHGGSTKTVPLRNGSPAIGQGDSECPKRDQRGVLRKDCDIGAFELR